MHFDALNKALLSFDQKYVIGYEEHLQFYDGLSTKKKLQLLTDKKGLPYTLHSEIFDLKQKYTHEKYRNLNPDFELLEILDYIHSKNISVALASNSIMETINIILKGLGIFHQFNYIVSNEDVLSPKPHPEMYWKIMSHFKALPSETAILEDSETGKRAALTSGATLVSIIDQKDLTIEKLS